MVYIMSANPRVGGNLQWLISSLRKSIHVKANTAESRHVKGFKEIPGPTALPFMSTPLQVLPQIGTHYNVIGVTMMAKYFKKYGDIVRFGTHMRIPPALLIFNPELFEQVYKNNKVTAPRFQDSPLSHFRKNYKSSLNRNDISKPNTSKTSANFEEIASNCVSKINQLKGKHYHITHSTLFYQYALKCIAESVHLENMTDDILSELEASCKEIFLNGYNIKSPATTHNDTKVYRMANDCFLNIYKNLEAAMTNASADDLTTVSDLILSYTDKIVHTSVALLYFLALNPAKQQILHDEIKHGEERSYLQACLKETERLLPLTGGNIRRTLDDIIVKGYHIPGGVDIILTHHQATQDRQHYSRPNDFIPERWLEDRKHALHYGHAHSYAFPNHESKNDSFVNQSVQTLIEKLIETYDVEWHGPKAELITRSLNHFSDPYHFVLNPLI